MNKLLVCGAMASLMLASCATSNTGMSRSEFLSLKGEWFLSDVRYDSSKFKIKPFDEGADAQCWVGSTWKLVPNNWSGSYTLNGGGSCPTVTQPIKFDAVDTNTFVFKKIASGTKAKQNTEGYQLDLVNRNENNFVLKQRVPFDGQIVEVTYHFQKIVNKHR